MKFYGWVLFLILIFPCSLLAQEAKELSSEEALEMITSRMESLSGGLSHMPTPPKLNRTIELPIPETSQVESDI